MLSRVRVVRLQIPNNMPQNAYMEQTVFPYSHLRRRAEGWGRGRGQRKTRRRKINEVGGWGGEKKVCVSMALHRWTGNHSANQPCGAAQWTMKYKKKKKACVPHGGNSFCGGQNEHFFFKFFYISQLWCLLMSVTGAAPVIEAWRYRHGVQWQSQAQVTDC